MNDEDLLEGAGRPLAGGVAIALFTTGYDIEKDEAVSLSVVGVQGDVLFSKTVKPHNLESWDACKASGGLGMADVDEAPALYELEDELGDVLDGAAFIVSEHFEFMRTMLDRSWIALPAGKSEVDLGEAFRLSHGTDAYPDEPATVATLESICAYYGIECDRSSTDGVAQTTMRCYRALVEEFEAQRAAKGEEYWQAREQRLAEEAAVAGSASTVEQIRERRMVQMNALLWVAAGIIFTSLVIQLYQRGGDVGFMVVAGAAAVFAYVRAVINWNRK